MVKGAANYKLTAAILSDKAKHAAFKALTATVGVGMYQVAKVPLSFESSGAWGPEMIKLWSEFKAVYKGLRRENYIRQGLPCTFTAFTFGQYWPQRISFAIARHTARMVMDGLYRAKRLAGV